MAATFVDSSCLVALALEEPSARRVAALLDGFARRLASNLLEADDRVTVPAELLDDAFDLERSLRHIDGVFAALDALEFQVHCDLFENPTSRHADYLLPVRTPWEREGLRIGNSELVDSMIHDGLWCPFCN